MSDGVTIKPTGARPQVYVTLRYSLEGAPARKYPYGSTRTFQPQTAVVKVSSGVVTEVYVFGPRVLKTGLSTTEDLGERFQGYALNGDKVPEYVRQVALAATVKVRAEGWQGPDDE